MRGLCCLWLAAGLADGAAARAAGPAPPAVAVRAGGAEIGLVLPERRPFRVFTLDDPRRVVVDFDGLDWPGWPTATIPPGPVAALRIGLFRPGVARLVVDLSAPMRVVAAEYRDGPGFRLDLAPTDAAAFAAGSGAPPGSLWATRDRPGSLSLPEPPPRRRPGEPLVVVLDPGHGGTDPGAMHDGLTEKAMVLGFAQALAAEMAATGRFRPLLTRETDAFLPLKARVDFAQDAGADIFISLHLNTVETGSASGVSVYSLSAEASDSAAARLAEFENRSDVLAGLDLEGESSAITRVLVDMAQRETNQRSRALAAAIVARLDASRSMIRSNPHREAGFRVLKAPDIPSVLIELGFLSDAEDRARLLSADWLAAMTGDLIAALDGWSEADRAARELVRR